MTPASHPSGTSRGRRGLPRVAKALLAALALAAPATATAPATAPTVGDAVEEAWGERATRRCVVCRVDRATPEHSEHHRGVLVPVCALCVDKYHAEPERWFARLQPRAALFQDDYVGRAPVRSPWFLIGLWMTAGLVCGALAGSVAVRRGHPAWPHVLAGVFGNVLGLVWALTRPRLELAIAPVGMKVPATRTPRPCRRCGRGNHPAATACADCGRPLKPRVTAEVGRTAED